MTSVKKTQGTQTRHRVLVCSLCGLLGHVESRCHRDPSPGIPFCRFFLTNSCIKGKECKFRHEKPKFVKNDMTYNCTKIGRDGKENGCGLQGHSFRFCPKQTCIHCTAKGHGINDCPFIWR